MKEKPQIRPIHNFNEYATEDFWVSLSTDSPGIVRISTGEIPTIGGPLVRPWDFKPL
jgi:hypothetical protein